MRKWLVLLAGALFAGAALAADITEAQARTVAAYFVEKDAIGMRTLPNRTVDTVTKRGGLWLVTLKPSGYLFVSVNRSARPIPTFSEHDFVEPEVGSPLAALLATAETNSANATGSKYETQWKTLLGEKVLRLTTSSTTEYVNIDPMVTTLWGQSYPYYELTPVVNGKHTVVGCVATAYAQIMRYWEWPAVLNEDVNSEHVADTVSDYRLCLGAGTVFDWQDMPKSYANDYPTRLKLARGSLFAGMLAKMKYNTSASGAQTSQPGINDWYTPYTCLDTTTSLEARVAGMKKSLQDGCPFMVSIDYNGTGHAVVGDGWQESASGSFVRLNYGWQESTIIYYDPASPDGVYLYQKPNPMVQNKPLAVSSTLPVKVEWAFPSKGYEKTLSGFDVVYKEVASTAADWTDDLTNHKGTIQGDCIQVETIADCGDGNVLRIGTSADKETYTWPTMVATENTVFSYDIHSYNALGMVVYIQVLDPTLGWLTLATPELGAKTEIPWATHSINLGHYAGRGIAIRIKAMRTSDTRYQDEKSRSSGVQFDNITLTNVRQAIAGDGVKVTAGKNDRSIEISDSLVADKAYLFQVTPTFSDTSITGIPGYPASCKIVSSAVEKPSIESVESVVSSAPAVQSGMYRACYLGRNQFGVYCSDATTKLEAQLSHRAIASEVQEPDAAFPGSYVTGYKSVPTTNDVTVAKKEGADGKFLVTVDFSDLTTYAKGTGMILTLIARNDEGDADRKDIFLCLSNTGSEDAIDVANLPESGTISGGGDTPSTPTTYYTISFSTTGSFVSQKQVESGKAIGTLPTTSLDGYIFLGWFTEISGGTKVTTDTVISKNVIFYAQWKENTPAVTTYTVTFDPNGGSPEMSRFVNENATVGTLPTTVTKSGYKLVGWFTAKDGGTQISASQTITANVTYYAHWEVSSGGGTGGGSTDTDTTRFCHGVSETDGAKTVTRSGTSNRLVPASYNLLLWWIDRYYEANGQNPSDYTAPNTSSIPSDGSYTIQSYTAKLIDDTGLSVTLPAGSEREQYFPSVEYTPEDWYGSATGDDRVKAIGRKIYEALANGPIGIRVRASSGYVAGAVIWGCDYATDGSVKYATKLRITDTTLSKDVKLVQRDLGNYTTTDGYYSGVGLKSFNSSNNGIIESFYPITGPAGTQQPEDPVVVTTHTVTFDANGGTAVDTISVEDGTTLSTLPTTSKSGYTFLGWFNGSKELTTATKISADVTYTAKWEQIVTPAEPYPEEPDDPVTPDDPIVIDDDPIGVAINDKDPGNDYTSTYKYEMYDNYWTARKRAIKDGKQLFILSGAAWCSNCAFVKNYLTSLGDDFKNKFVVYYADHDSTACQCFQGGLPQYGVADPRTVDAFTGTLNGTTRSWDLAWQTDTSGIYQQDRGGYASDRVEKVVNAGSTAAKYDYPTNLVLRGLSTLGTGKTGRYELYAQFEDGVEMPVDYGVEWSVLSGDGTFADANVDGRDIGALTVNSGSVVIRACSTFYFTGTKTMTVDCAPESDIVSVEILADEVNLEDDSAPTIEAQATLKNGKKIPVFGFGTWEATFDHQLPRTACPELEENSEAALNPTITVDNESRLNYALSANGLLEVCDQVINLTLTVNGQSHTKQITVWGPTKVIPSAWTMLSAATQTTPGVVRLSCIELKYNYGGEIKTTTDSYFASYEIVLKNGIYSQTSHLRGLTVYVNDPNSSREYKVGLKARKVNGKYTGYLPTNPEEIATAPTVSCIARGADKTTIEKGLVPAGYFTAFFPTRSDYDVLAEEDYDQDGFKNWEEYVLGTDPTNASDAFTLMQGYQHLSAPAGKGDTMQYKVMYTQRAGRKYYIDGKKDWNDDWTQVASVSLADMNESDVTSFTYPKNDSATFADACSFFRVRAALNEHDFNYPDTKPIIVPNMLVAAPDSVIDLSASNITTTAILNLSSFDTDATDAGTVYVKVPAGAKAGDVLISAPKSAKTSLEACKPYESGDVELEVVEDSSDASRMVLKVKGEEPVVYESPFMFTITENTNWSDIEWTDKNGHTAKWADLGAGSDAEVVLEASVPFVVTVDADVTVSAVTADENVTLKFENAWPTGFATALVKDAWQGTVLIVGKTDCTGTAGCTFENLGNANSVVAFDNVSGWFNGFASNASNLKGKEYAYTLEIGAGGLTINNGSSNTAVTFAKLTGTGALSVGKSGNPTMRIVALDASDYTGTLSVVGNAGIIIGTPTVNAANGEIRAEGTALASASYKIGGSGVVRLGQTDTAGKYNLSAVVGVSAFSDGFTGTLALGAGRYVYSANCVPSNVKISVVDGAQLFVSDGVTVANAVTIAGNGWGGEPSHAVSKAALRLGNNAVISGTLTVASDAKIGVHDGNTGTLNGEVSGSGTLTKWAGGTLLLGSAVASNFTGRFVVGQGTVKANTGSVNFFGCNTDARAIVVEKGATFDMNGKHSADLTICLNGGTLTNTGTGITSDKKTIRKIILTDDSTIAGSQNYGLIASNYAESFLDLQGHMLTFAMTAGKDFWMPNTTATNGTIVVRSGRFYPWHAGSSKTSRYYCTLRLEGGEFKVQGDSTVDTLVLAGGAITDSYALTISKQLVVEKTTTISRAITLGEAAKVNLPANATLTVNTAIDAAKFVLPDGYELNTVTTGSTYAYSAIAPAPAIEGGDEQGTVEVTDEKIVVTPNENVTEIIINNPGERKVEIPPSVDRIGGVADSSKIVIKHTFGDNKSVDLTPIMKFTQTGDGLAIALDESAKGKVVNVDGEDIPVEPTIGGQGLTALPTTVTIGVKTIPGLKYQVMKCATPGGAYEPVGSATTATGARLSLDVSRSSDPSAFYKISVSK